MWLALGLTLVALVVGVGVASIEFTFISMFTHKEFHRRYVAKNKRPPAIWECSTCHDKYRQY